MSNAEFVLYISAMQTTSCGSSTLAFAGSCELEDMYDRLTATLTAVVYHLVIFTAGLLQVILISVPTIYRLTDLMTIY